MKLPIMEIFGPTIQGEGKLIGQKTMFVRTAGCDYKCAWCDSAFTWDGSEKATMLTPDEVIAKLLALGERNFSHVTISGGNPLLIGEPMQQLLQKLNEMAIAVSVETQGTVWQDWVKWLDEVTLSPKPPSSGMDTNFEQLDAWIDKLGALDAAFSIKIVVFDEADFAYAKQVFHRYASKTSAFYLSVGNPTPRSGDDIRLALLDRLEQLFAWVIADPEMNDVKPLPQLHTLVWSNKRGV